ncbi:MAG: hypothetical protein QE274_00265 [Verrucomicrobiaceae bacterium]|nr:hypothetical protein [Verrucomicrobiaceae bacterium]
MCEALVELRPWEMSFGGYRWRDMPGTNEDDKKINFALFRRGELKLEEVKLEVEILGELPQEVSVPIVDAGWQLGAEGKRKKARAILEARVRRGKRKLRVVRAVPFGKVGCVFAPGLGRSKRAVSSEQGVLVEQYRALSGRMNRMDGARSMMIGAVRKMGGTEGAFLNGLEKGKAWTPQMIGWVKQALPVMRAHVEVVEATLGRVRVAWGRFEKGRMMRRLWMVDLTRASGLSDQAVKDFRAAKLPTLKTLKALEVGLMRLNNMEKGGGL